MKLCKVKGIIIELHWSWFIALGVFTYLLSTQHYPVAMPSLGVFGDWSLGFISTVLAFLCVLMHELAHSLVARTKHVTVERIHLFLLGGMASMQGEADNPKDDFLIAAAGPVVSFALAGMFWMVNNPLADYLMRINMVLGIFNMIPAFPLDGGRIMRDIIWWLRSNYITSSLFSIKLGRAMAVLFMIGGCAIISMGAANGLWMLLVGGYMTMMNNELGRHYTSFAKLKDTIDSEVIHDVVAIPETTPITAFVDDYFVPYGFHGYPVTNSQRKVTGMVTYWAVKKIMENNENTDSITVSDIMYRFDFTTFESSYSPVILLGAPSVRAAEKLMFGGFDRLYVYTPKGAFVGIIMKSALIRKGEIDAMRSRHILKPKQKYKDPSPISKN